MMLPQITVEGRITPGEWARAQLTAAAPATMETEDGRLVASCEHGLGHTVAVTAMYYETLTGESPFYHGCDGCCGGELAG